MKRWEPIKTEKKQLGGIIKLLKKVSKGSSIQYEYDAKTKSKKVRIVKVQLSER